jgi:hypothetical protein
MEKISSGFLIILLGVIWVGPPIYWGYINGSRLAIPIWSVMLAFTAVGAGWRHRKCDLFKSFLYGVVFAATGVISAYLLGLAITGL